MAIVNVVLLHWICAKNIYFLRHHLHELQTSKIARFWTMLYLVHYHYLMWHRAYSDSVQEDNTACNMPIICKWYHTKISKFIRFHTTNAPLTMSWQTSSSAVAKRPRDASCLSVVSFVASVVQYLERSFLSLVTSASDLPVRTIRFCSVVFGVTSSLAVIHTICGRPWLCIVRERAWSVSRCRTTTTVTDYRAWRFVQHTRSIRPAIYVSQLGSEARYRLRIAISAYRTCIRRPCYDGFRRNIAILFGMEKLEWCGYPTVKKTFEDIFIRFDMIHERDRDIDRQTDTAWRHRPRLQSIALQKTVRKKWSRQNGKWHDAIGGFQSVRKRVHTAE